MPFVTCHSGQLQVLRNRGPALARGLATGHRHLDALLPGNVFALGSIHELLALPDQPVPLFVATFLAAELIAHSREIQGPFRDDSRRFASDGFICAPFAAENKTIAWCDPEFAPYPPALAAAGARLERFLWVRPTTPSDHLWAIAECLRCPGVGVTIARPRRLAQLHARRLQLAAEAGGGIGLLLRRMGADSTQYAAATRWLIKSMPGERLLQRWSLELVHGHGGRIHEVVILEASRETNHVHILPAVADRPAETKPALRIA